MLSVTERQAILDEIDAGTFDLGDALDDIATEQKGEGVRRAIYGGILLANESGSGGADAKARALIDINKENLEKQMSALEKSMGTFIANNSGTLNSTRIEETTLFNAAPTNSYQGNVSGYDWYFDLDAEATGYNYIDIRYGAFGRNGIFRASMGDFNAGCHWYSVQHQTAISTDSGGTNPRSVLRIAEYSLTKLSNTRVSLDVEVWEWDGNKNNNGVLVNIQSSWGIGMSTITGVKYVSVSNTNKDTELSDMRVGYDGTEYTSAGAALRAQIQALSDRLDALEATE